MSETAAAELKKLVKQLQNTSTEEKVSILQILKKDFQVNEAILRESKAGLAVGKLRTHEAKEVSELAREIVKKWKNEVERAKGVRAQRRGHLRTARQHQLARDLLRSHPLTPPLPPQ